MPKIAVVVNAVFDLLAAMVLCIIVCAISGAVVLVAAFVYGAHGAALPWWFGAGFGFALVAIAALFLWERRA